MKILKMREKKIKREKAGRERGREGRREGGSSSAKH